MAWDNFTFTFNVKGKHHFEDQGVGGRVILKYFLEKQNGILWTDFIWLRTEISDWLLWTR
jgi:hypothetical protein